MLCTLNWARERGFESADIPLHVYGPPGLADYIRLDSDPVCVFFPISFLGQCCCVQVLFAVSVAFALDSQHMLLAQCYQSTRQFTLSVFWDSSRESTDNDWQMNVQSALETQI